MQEFKLKIKVFCYIFGKWSTVLDTTCWLYMYLQKV